MFKPEAVAVHLEDVNVVGEAIEQRATPCCVWSGIESWRAGIITSPVVFSVFAS
jgi:hypothetical protein